jgi:selenophosphate synthetase-related protein
MLLGTTNPTSVTHCKNVFPQNSLTATAAGEVIETPNLLGQMY